MRAIGSSYLARLHVARDFENSESVEAFLKSRGLQNSVESLSQSILRVKASVGESIQDAFVSTFSSDVANDLEKKIISFAQAEISQLSTSKKIDVQTSFQTTADCSNLSVLVIYSFKTETEEFNIFNDIPDLSEKDIESVTNRNPALLWLLDERSPLYSAESMKNLRIYLLLDRLCHTEFTKQDKVSFKLFAKIIIKKFSERQTDIPDELNSAYKNVVSLIKHLSNNVRPEVSVHKHAVPVRVGSIEHQVLITVSGAKPFTYAIGVIAEKSAEDYAITICATAIKEGILSSPWTDLFKPEYVMESLSIDQPVLTFLLSLFEYRVPHRRTEKLANQIIQTFGYVPIQVDEQDVKFNVKEVVEIPTTNLDRVKSKMWIYKSKIDRLVEFCADKNIGISGSFIFFDDGRPDNFITLPIWEIKDGRTESSMKKIQYTNRLLILNSIDITLGPKSNIKYLDALGGMIMDALKAKVLVSIGE